MACAKDQYRDGPANVNCDTYLHLLHVFHCFNMARCCIMYCTKQAQYRHQLHVHVQYVLNSNCMHVRGTKIYVTRRPCTAFKDMSAASPSVTFRRLALRLSWHVY
jgi:hypothetical protein